MGRRVGESRSMKFCMLTSFFGRHSFGGDAVYVERLNRALLKRGHEVDVVYSVDAHAAVRGNERPVPFEAYEGMRIHGLKSAWGLLAPLSVHQTGRPGVLRGPIEEILAARRFDVLHFHNISLIGGPGALSLRCPGNPRRLLTAHEYWLVCPLSVLWKFGERTCEKAECTRCMLKASRPPQWWRGWRDWQQELDAVDVLLTPSQASARLHRERGLRRAMEVLPYFVGDEWREKLPPAPSRRRPYFAFAGRLVKEKGLDVLIPMIRKLPGVDLRIAGRGPYEAKLRSMASGMENVEFLGYLGFQGLREFYAGARALVAPSLMVETFGYVVLESHAVGTPAIVPDLGGIAESVRKSGGGIVYQTDAELFDALCRLAEDDVLRKELGGNARDAVERFWTEEQHLERYFAHLNASNA